MLSGATGIRPSSSPNWGHGVALMQGLNGREEQNLVSQEYSETSLSKERLMWSAFCFAFSDNL
jgi:hypothetical protein